MDDKLAFVGLFFTLVGASLLFFYGLPRKVYGNVVITGDSAFKFEAKEGVRDVPDSEWKSVADSFQRRAKILNSTGFGLVAVGTLLQMVTAY